MESWKVADLEQNVVDMEGQKVGAAALDACLFGAKVHGQLVHAVVRYQLAKRRAGTHSTLNRKGMRGGGRKPFRQKGTGHARAGSNTSPLWYGGAVAHGPSPRSYEFKLTKRVRRQALAAVLSDRKQNDKLVLVDKLSVSSGKTKELQEVLKKLGLAEQRVALVLPAAKASEEVALVWRAGRNLPRLQLLSVEGVNVYDLVRNQVVLSTTEAIAALQQRFAGDV
ncbi:MAG: 50S ribosomal protein L4 [Deltaproteobacteria bacterium]|nr:50S ribosomal protein L4 [Deltaproteobacteria bacterium]